MHILDIQNLQLSLNNFDISINDLNLESDVWYIKTLINRYFNFSCPVIDHEFCHNIVNVAVDPQGNFYNNKLSNFQLSLTGASHKFQIYVCVCILTI